MEETWKSVSLILNELDAESLSGKDYQISNLGNFRILNSDGSIEPGHITYSDSQASVSIGKKQRLLHRIVAMLFVENEDPDINTVVIHIDGNHRNNRADNLKWVSVSERNERRYVNQAAVVILRCIDEDKVFVSVSSASLYYAIPVDIIRNSIINKEPCFGHEFEYISASDQPALYLSTRKAKSLSSMLNNIEELRAYFNEVTVK